MKSNRANSFLFLVAILAFTSVASTSFATSSPCKQGGLGKAVDLAYQDFHSFLRSYAGSTGGKLKVFLLEIDSYEVKAIAEGDKYIVKFVPFGYSEGVIKGGGAKYTIDKCTLKIDGIQGKQPIE